MHDNFWPQDSLDTTYIATPSYSEISLQEIIDRARSKWGENVDMDDIRIEAEYIHTDAIFYDRYDPSDYMNFIKLTNTKIVE